MAKIDLGSSPEKSAVSLPEKNKRYFPSVHVADLKEAKPEVGDSVIIHGVVQSVSHSKSGSSCTVEAHSMTHEPGSGGLDEAMNKIASKKMMDSEDAADESDPNDEEE